MNIDWKHLAHTPGYRSLKAAMIYDLQKGHRDKATLMKLFKRVIGLAQNYSHHTGQPIDDILTQWENNRDYWWLNYYSQSNFHKMRMKDSLKPMGIKGLRKYYHNSVIRDPIIRKRKICQRIQQMHKDQSTKKKPRWTKAERESKFRYS